MGEVSHAIVEGVRTVWARMTVHHWTVIGVQLVVFAGMLELVTTWRGFAILVIGQLGATITALVGDSLAGRKVLTEEERAARRHKLNGGSTA